MSLCGPRNPGFQSSLLHIPPRLWPAFLFPARREAGRLRRTLVEKDALSGREQNRSVVLTDARPSWLVQEASVMPLRACVCVFVCACARAGLQDLGPAVAVHSAGSKEPP